MGDREKKGKRDIGRGEREREEGREGGRQRERQRRGERESEWDGIEKEIETERGSTLA